MANNTGFCLFFDWVEVLNDLDPADAMTVIRAIADYEQNGNDPVAAVPKAVRPIMRLMFAQIKRREQVSEARSNAGQASARARSVAVCSNNVEQNSTNVEQKATTETETITLTETENNNTRSNERDARPREKRFVPPTVDEVAAYAREKGLTFDAEEFVDYYANKQWRIGGSRTQMSDWRAAARNWAKKEWRDKPKPKPSEASFDTDEFFDAALKRTYADDTPDDPLVGELKARFMTA